MPRCLLCGYGGKKRGFIGWGIERHVCNLCWDECDGDVEEAMAKKKAKEKRKEPEIRPCKYCERTDFDNDYARRAHQGKCPKNPKNKGKEKASKKAVKKKRTASQVGRGSRAKGGKFENVVKKELARWWGENPKTPPKDSAFQRAPGSGGQSPKNWPLDIHVPLMFPWAVECKNREGSVGLEAAERFLTGKYPVVSWFLEAEKELRKAKILRPLLLVFTRNHFPIFAALRRPGRKGEGKHWTPTFEHMTLCGGGFGELIMCRFERLLNAHIPKAWTSLYAWADKDTFRLNKVRR